MKIYTKIILDKNNQPTNKNLSNEKEKDDLWEMTGSLPTSINDDKNQSKESNQLPHPNHYKKWFEYLDKIDLIIKKDLFNNPKKLKYFFLKIPILIVVNEVFIIAGWLFNGPFSGRIKKTEYLDFNNNSTIEIKILLAP